MPSALSLVEFVATMLVLSAVHLIGRLDIRGQQLMLAAQAGWIIAAVARGQWWLLTQSVVLFVLTWSAIRHWRRGLLLRREGVGHAQR